MRKKIKTMRKKRDSKERERQSGTEKGKRNREITVENGQCFG